MLSPNLPIGVIVFPDETSFMKKHMLPDEGKNATSPFLKSDLALSVPWISKTSCFLETEGALNSYSGMMRIYNVLRKF